MKLYYTPGLCSLAPHIALREVGARFELARVDVRKKLLADGSDFLSVNPKGQVPVLELDDGARLTEAAVILQYIADANPRHGLSPAPGGMQRYRLQEWLNFIAAELHKTLAPLFRPDTPDDYKPVLKANAARKFANLEAHLAGTDYLHGDAFSVADAYGFTILRWAGVHDIDLGQWPRVAAYVARIAQRPRVAEAMAAEGLSQ